MMRTCRYLDRSWKAASLAGLPDTSTIKSKWGKCKRSNLFKCLVKYDKILKIFKALMSRALFTSRLSATAARSAGWPCLGKYNGEDGGNSLDDNNEADDDKSQPVQLVESLIMTMIMVYGTWSWQYQWWRLLIMIYSCWPIQLVESISQPCCSVL